MQKVLQKDLTKPKRTSQFLATSNKQQATSNKQQATSNKRHKRAICPRKFSHTTIQFYSKQPWFSKGGCVPLKPPAFCRGKERHLSDASFPLSPYDPLSPFQRCQRGLPFGNPIRKQKGIQTTISKELRRYENRTSCPIFNPSLLRKLAYSWQ